MNDLDRNLTLLIGADVDLHANERTGWQQFEGLKRGTHLSVFIGGVHYSAVVHDCPERIRPGTDGKAEFVFVSNAVLSAGLTVGAELAFGRANIEAGKLRIRSIDKVRVERTRSDQRGYTIFPADQ